MTGSPATNLRPANIPALAEAALRHELDLTPKPGLVDRCNNGAHRDMDYALFRRSIAAIAPWFTRFEQLGYEHADKPADVQLRLLRPVGIACEQAMFSATGGVNTHKGGIFSLGLLCFAAGRLRGRGRTPDAPTLCRQVGEICRGLVARELAARRSAATAGERQFRQLGLTGARGEAESGFATVRRFVLPYWHRRQLHGALLRLMAANADSNLVTRGGVRGLRYVQGYARRLLADGWDRPALEAMDRALTQRNLSPGGSADLLAVAWVLGECEG